ncbi:unnamed protein product [Linum trigynum]|uniref:Uncharacterized protein n=1 Tax=Linum trigynum TaxID=586398 RepID=A0AAV2DYY7_9ROSI
MEADFLRSGNSINGWKSEAARTSLRGKNNPAENTPRAPRSRKQAALIREPWMPPRYAILGCLTTLNSSGIAQIPARVILGFLLAGPSKLLS